MMADHEFHIKVKADTTEVREALERLKKQMRQSQLAQKILTCIERAEHEVIGVGESGIAQTYYQLVDDIKELCEEEMNKQ